MLKPSEQEPNEQKELSVMIARFEHFTTDLIVAAASKDTNDEED